MSAPDERSLTGPHVVTPAKLQTGLGANPFPGFALPEAALHSIPLPGEFDQFVRSAIEENQVDQPFPKFFNGIFRRQGVVNKHTLRALESVGKALSQLAGEIESRDRVLEKLAAHLNLSGDHVQRGQMTLAHFTQELANQISEVAASSRARLEEISQRSRIHLESLVAKARATENRLGDVQQALDALHGRSLGLTRENDRRAEDTRRLEQSIEAVEKNAGQALSDAVTPIRQNFAQLKADLAGLGEEARLARDESQSQIEAALQRISSQKLDIEQLHREFVETTAQLARSSEDAQQQQVTSRQAIETLRRENEEHNVGIRTALDQIEARLTQVISREEIWQAALQKLDSVEAQVTSEKEEGGRWRRELEARITGVESGLKAKVAQLEKDAEDHKAERESSLKALAVKESALATSLRTSTLLLEAVSSDQNRIQTILTQLTDTVAEISKRTAGVESNLHGPIGEIAGLLPRLREQLEQLGQDSAVEKNQKTVQVAAETVDALQTSESDGFYVALEARFRGPRSVIRERQARYLPVIAEARARVETYPPKDLVAGSDTSPSLANDGVLDLGCGRGEWLELLRENQIPALGVDRNRYFLQICRQRNCPVADADILLFLKKAPDESMAVVTCFHVIEHLPPPVFQELVSQVFRVLRRGGVAIFETPNPGNVLTSTLNFLLDPTHLKPVHPELARLVLEMAGFSSVRTEFMSPYEPHHRVNAENDALAERFNSYFYGPQDYAVMGVKP